MYSDKQITWCQKLTHWKVQLKLHCSSSPVLTSLPSLTLPTCQIGHFCWRYKAELFNIYVLIIFFTAVFLAFSFWLYACIPLALPAPLWYTNQNRGSLIESYPWCIIAVDNTCTCRLVSVLSWSKTYRWWQLNPKTPPSCIKMGLLRAERSSRYTGGMLWCTMKEVMWTLVTCDCKDCTSEWFDNQQ